MIIDRSDESAFDDCAATASDHSLPSSDTSVLQYRWALLCDRLRNSYDVYPKFDRRLHPRECQRTDGWNGGAQVALGRRHLRILACSSRVVGNIWYLKRI